MSRQAQLGLFAVVAVALLFGIFYVITDFGTRHNGYQIGVHFASAAGLPTGAQVFFSGVSVGTVDQVQLLADNTVDVILSIQNGVNIPTDSQFTVQAPLTGTPNLVITPPRYGRTLRPGQTATPVPAYEILPKRVLPIAQQPIGTPVISAADLMQKGQSEIARLNALLALLQKSEPRVLYTVQATIDNVDVMTQQLRAVMAQSGGNLDRMTAMLDSAVARNQYKIDSLLTSLNSTALSLNKSMDAITSMATDPRLKQNLVGTTTNIRVLTANLAGLTGDLRTITGNSQTQAQLRDTTANLDAAAQKADSLLGTLGGRSSVYGVDAGATPYPLPSGGLGPPGSQTPPPAGAAAGLGKRVGAIVGNLVQARARFTFGGPAQGDINALIVPHGAFSGMVGANDIGGNTTWNVVGLKNLGGLRVGGGVLYSQIGALASYNAGKFGAETRVYDLRHPTFDIYGNLNIAQWARLFLGERDSTRADRRTVYGLELRF